MKKIIEMVPIVTELVERVKIECPHSGDPAQATGFNYERCLKCPFFLPGLSGKGSRGACAWIRYETEVYDWPSDKHYKAIKCAYCGEELKIYSHLMSALTKGECERCPKCNLLHQFLEKNGNKTVFAIPLKEWEERQ